MNNFNKQNQNFKLKNIALLLVVATGVFSCVKNTPFKASYTVPSSYNFENKDSSAKARIIMMEGMGNYLATASNGVLDTLLIDSLFANKNNSFTAAMAPNYLYPFSALNRMKEFSLANETENRTEILAFTDSLYIASKSFNILATNGKAGYLQSGTNKYIVGRNGMEYKEVWAKAMIGALAMSKISSRMAGLNGIDPLNLIYDYAGFPRNYDPSFNYETPSLKADRPLSVAALLSLSDTGKINAPKIYEEFRRAGASIKSGNSGFAGASIELIKYYIDQTVAAAILTYLDNVKKSTEVATQLHNLSIAYGLVWAMQFRLGLTNLTNQEYNTLKTTLETNFYTLIQEPGFTKINQVRNGFALAYNLK